MPKSPGETPISPGDPSFVDRKIIIVLWILALNIEGVRLSQVGVDGRPLLQPVALTIALRPLESSDLLRHGSALNVRLQRAAKNAKKANSLF